MRRSLVALCLMLGLALFADGIALTRVGAAPDISSAPIPQQLHTDALTLTSAGQALHFSTTGLVVSNGRYALQVGFVEANPVMPHTATTADDPSSKTGLPELSVVRYEQIWPGIDLTYNQGGGILRSTYTVTPGADPSQIRLAYNRPLALENDGNLQITLESGSLQESPPLAWQQVAGQQVAVAVRFVLFDAQTVGFVLGDYDLAAPLWIDPTLTWNTFLGSGWAENFRGADSATAITVDGSGAVYVAGTSEVSWGSPLRPYTGGRDAFVAKLSNNGELTWHTFLGSSDFDDEGNTIAVDGSGNVYVAGLNTTSDQQFIRNYAYVAKLASSGELLWNTIVGGTGSDEGRDIAVDSSGSVYVAGYSGASWGTPLRPHSGESDAFVAKLASSGELLWNTFLGSPGYDGGSGIAVDSSGAVYVAGNSSDTWGTPLRPHSGEYDAYVAKLTSSGELTWHTFFSNRANAQITAIAVDSSGTVYVAATAYIRTIGQIAFVVKLVTSGEPILFAHLGGNSDEGRDITVDSSGSVYVAGYSGSSWGNPVRPHADGGSDAFVAKFSYIIWLPAISQ